MIKSLTLLSKDEVSGENKLEVLKKYGVTARVTDFAAILGVDTVRYYDKNHVLVYDGRYFLKDIFNNGHEISLIVDENAFDNRYSILNCTSACRPIFDINSHSFSNLQRNSDGVLIGEFGEYPQQIVSDDVKKLLEDRFKNGLLNESGKTYYCNAKSSFSNAIEPYKNQYIEYIYDGKKFIRVQRKTEHFDISVGRVLDEFKFVWIEVEPVRWLIDELSDKAICEKGIVAGMTFNNDDNITNVFENTTLYEFMNTHLINDLLINNNFVQDKLISFDPKNIVNNNVVTENDVVVGNSVANKNNKVADNDAVVANNNLFETNVVTESNIVVDSNVEDDNPFCLDFSKVSEEEIIKGCLESNIAVFMHGASSEGKSARVKQLDPNLEIVYLRNSSPDSLNGKSVVLNSNENVKMSDIPPTWYKKILEKSEAEPDKTHILFFDEITNALPSIQGMAYNIILDREVNGIWKLPNNVKIVAAGNEMKDSLAANQLAEPLFNRFAHVYIKTTANKWLEWAITSEKEYKKLEYKNLDLKYKIHPAIISYISFKGEESIRTPYNGVEPNADPRKWEMASRLLEITNKPEMLRALVGQDITDDFIDFCSQKVITLEDVVNGKYDLNNIHLNFSKKWACTNAMLRATEENIEKVSEFVELLGSEYASMFYKLWCGDDEQRKEIIANIIIENRDRARVFTLNRI